MNDLLTHANETLPVHEWARRLGITRRGLAWRLRRWDVARALTAPVMVRSPKGTCRPRERERRIYAGMVQRCTNPKVEGYPYYGGKGIRVCARWMDSIDAFVADMGPAPTNKHSIERLDNSRDYSPENCRWATMKEQQRHRTNNRLIAFRGETACVAEWADRSGLPAGVITKRLRAGWDSERIFSTPARPSSRKLSPEDAVRIRERVASGVSTQADLVREYGVTSGLISMIVTGKRWSGVVDVSVITEAHSPIEGAP